jgi:hypothetical protein
MRVLEAKARAARTTAGLGILRRALLRRSQVQQTVVLCAIWG